MRRQEPGDDVDRGGEPDRPLVVEARLGDTDDRAAGGIEDRAADSPGMTGTSISSVPLRTLAIRPV